jgi:TonB-dependent starch-binding outer membrane protein SusC
VSTSHWCSRALLGAALIGSAAQAQTRQVTGRVLDAGSRNGVPNAQVAVLGASTGAQTNENGAFRLTAPTGDVTLVVRMIGYKQRHVPLPAGQPAIDVLLERDALRLEQVVVTGQATGVQRANAATAVSTVNAEELARVPSVSLENSLQGKVVGAAINMNSGAPGGGAQVQIRGVTSLIGNGEPLYVVDGVLVSNAAISSGINSISRGSGSGISSNQDNLTNRLADVNPNDIADVQVLKGAAASAIYGSKATNGVIVITTKRGAVGAPRVSLTQRLGRYESVRLPGSRRFPTLEAAYAAQPAQRAVIDSLVAANGGTVPYYDYQKALYGQHKPSYETIATISGGSASTRYYVSGTHKYDAGTMLNTAARRQSVRTNVDQAFGDRLSVNVGLNLVQSLAQRGLSNNSTDWVSPLYLLAYTPALVDLNQRMANGLYVRNPFGGGGGSNASNPFESMAYLKSDETVDRQIGSTNIKYTPLATDRHTVQLTALGGVDQFNQGNGIYSPPFMQYEPFDGFLGTSVESNSRSKNTNGSLNAVWTFTPGFRFLGSATASAGVSSEQAWLNSYRIRAQNLVPGVTLVNQGTIDDAQSKSLVRNLAYYAQEEILAFGDRLYVQGAFRADRSSVNGDPDKYYIFPKGSASYRFVAPFRGADEVKLRAAVGTSGNQPTYGARDVLLSANGIMEGSNSIVPSQSVGNPKLTPEKMTEQEYGIDVAFLGRRAAVEATYFDRTITDMLLQAPLPPSSGLGVQVINGGKMTSKGVELGLTLVPVQRGAVNWTSRTQYYHIDQQIVSLPIAPFTVGSTGFGTSFGRAFIKPGYSTTAIWANMTRPNGTVVDTVLGDATPKFTMQFANDVTARNLALNVLLDWKKGGDVINITQNRFDEGKNSRDYDDPSPDPAIGKTLGEYRYNSWRGGNDARVLIQDGSFVKLREVTLTYTLPARWAQRVSGRVRETRLALTGRNLYTWSDYWGADPEANNFGNNNVIRAVDLASYPPSRSFFFSVELGF